MMANAESLITILKLTGIFCFLLAIAAGTATVYLGYRYKPKRLKKDIYEIEHPAPKPPEPQKKKIVQFTISQQMQLQLENILTRPSVGEGWAETGG